MTDLTINTRNAVQKNQTASLGPLSLQLRQWGAMKTEAAIRTNQTSGAVAYLSLKADEDYYTGVVTGEQAIKAWRVCVMDLGVVNRSEAEQVGVMATFAKECIAERWSQYTLNRAFVAFRRTGPGFAPTCGQLRKALMEAKSTQGPKYYREMMDVLERFAKPAEPEQKKTGADGMDRQELQAFILKLEKGKIAKEYPTASGKMIRFTKYDDKMLAGLKSRLARLQVTA